MDSIRGTSQPPPLVLWAGPHSPPRSHLSSLLPQSTPGVMCGWAVPQLPHGHMVSQLILSQPVTASFMGKHNTCHLTLGQVVKCWVLGVKFIARYWKCLSTMGPTLGSNFCHGCLSIMHWAHRIEDTNTLS